MSEADEFDVSVDRIERVLSMVKARRASHQTQAQNPWDADSAMTQTECGGVELGLDEEEEPRSGFPTPTKDVSPVIIQTPVSTLSVVEKTPSIYDRLAKKARIMHHSLASSIDRGASIRPTRRAFYGSDRTDLLNLLKSANRRVVEQKQKGTETPFHHHHLQKSLSIQHQTEQRTVTTIMTDIHSLSSRPYLSKKRRKQMVQRLGKERLAVNGYQYNLLKRGFIAFLMQTMKVQNGNAITSSNADGDEYIDVGEGEGEGEGEDVSADVMNEETPLTGQDSTHTDTNTNEVILYHPPPGSDTAIHSTLMHNHWEYIVSENSYYYNHETGESQWTAPQGFETQSPWIRHYDANGHEYFVHSISGQSEWTIPPELEN